MKKKDNKKVFYIDKKKDLVATGRDIVRRLSTLSGSEALNMILDHENPVELVHGMTKMDLFWLIKKVGEDDSFPLLSLTSNEQWQYILDLELWERDLIDMEKTYQWLNRLQKTDPQRLARYLYSEDGNMMSHLFFSKVIDVKIKDNDDFIPPKGYISFDNLYYIYISDRKNAQDIEQMLKNMALEDHNRYQALLLSLQGTIPAEIEEDMYRLRNVRLAEEGYLPFEEAASVYSYQKIDQLKKDSSDYILFTPEDEETRTLVPITPLVIAQGDDLFTMTVSGVYDYLLLDRLRLEFAGLCNQIFAADHMPFEEVDDLVSVCRKAGGYINIGLEKLSGGDLKTAEDFLKNHPLITLFRAGFSQALELRWKAERWIRSSWFDQQDLTFDFWGEDRGGLLKGILQDKPLLYCEKNENDPYRDFRSLEEAAEASISLDRMIILDKIAEGIFSEQGIDASYGKDTDMVIYPLIFTFWVRHLCGLPQGVIPLSPGEAKRAFEILRAGETPPYEMSGYKHAFIDFYGSMAVFGDADDPNFIQETLSVLWDEFKEEYAMVNVKDLDPKYSRYILISL